MQQKPIKRNINIVRLSREHHYGLLFCWKIRQGMKQKIDTNRIIKYVNHFWQHDLQKHFAEEEEIVFADLKDELVQKAIDDHKKISDLINKPKYISEEDAAEGLKKLADIVDEHIRFEERELFPHLEKKLTRLQLDTIGKKLNKAEVLDLKAGYEDEFWSR